MVAFTEESSPRLLIQGVVAVTGQKDAPGTSGMIEVAFTSSPPRYFITRNMLP